MMLSSDWLLHVYVYIIKYIHMNTFTHVSMMCKHFDVFQYQT